ncbi:MAG: septation ring formation regulator EzrA [Bacilli bacterium]
MDNVVLLMWTYFTIAVILITIVLTIIQKYNINKYKKAIENLEKEKNLITSIPVLSELSKIQPIVKNEKLEEKYNEWHNEFEKLKEENIARISDMILDLDYLMEQKDYLGVTYKMAKIEMEIYKTKTKANLILNEIKAIILNEEKNRNIITKYKAIFRELMIKFDNNKEDYGELTKSIELQMENIQKRFQEFEEYMDNNNYDEVIHIVKALDEMINNMSVIIEEGPSIVLMAHTLIPKKIEEVTSMYKKMQRDGYLLDYLNIEYNISEVNKKISSILDHAKVLNFEDSLFELKTILDYFDSLFIDFENEKLQKSAFEENYSAVKKKITNVNKIMTNIYVQIESIKYNYDLSEEELAELDSIKKEIEVLNEEFNTINEHRQKKTWPYSQLAKELEQLMLCLVKVEDDLDIKLQTIGSMHEDEMRAIEQLEDIQSLLNKAKTQMRTYKLPTIPNNYYIQLKEANESIRNIRVELEKKPIAIKVLNIRVDTARDLVLKLYNTTNEMVKTAMLVEMAIVYGNRYRSLKLQVEQGLNNAEILFNKGEYKLALETVINAIDLVEPGIYQRLLSVYSSEDILNKES